MKDITRNGIEHSDMNHVEDTLKGRKGWYKFNPLFGVGIDDEIGGNASYNILESKAKQQLKAQGILNYELKMSK